MAKSIIFVSGKGGVGKTMISTNVSMALAKKGERVLLLDADFGLANANIMLGIKSQKSLADVLEGEIDINDAINTTSEGLKVLSGGSGLPNLIGMDQETRFRIIRLLEPLEKNIDYLIIDAPAGIEENALCYAGASDDVCLVITGDPTSFMDAYATVKVLSLEKNINKVKIIINMVNNTETGEDIFNRFQKIVCRFLPVTLSLVGVIPSSNKIRAAIQNRTPLKTSTHMKTENDLLAKISGTILDGIEPRESGRLTFFQGLLTEVA